MSVLTAIVSVLTSLLALGLALGQLTPTGRSMRRLEALNKLRDGAHDDVQKVVEPSAKKEADRLETLVEGGPSSWVAPLVAFLATIVFALISNYGYSLTGETRNYWEDIVFDGRVPMGAFAAALFFFAVVGLIVAAVDRWRR